MKDRSDEIPISEESIVRRPGTIVVAVARVDQRLGIAVELVLPGGVKIEDLNRVNSEDNSRKEAIAFSALGRVKATKRWTSAAGKKVAMVILADPSKGHARGWSGAIRNEEKLRGAVRGTSSQGREESRKVGVPA